MPELTWTTALVWFGVLTGAVSIAALIQGLVGTWQMRTLQVDVHTATQLTLSDMAKGFRESQEALGRAIAESQQALGRAITESQQALGRAITESQQALGRAISESQQALGQILERMDQRAEERHREALQVIQALRG